MGKSTTFEEELEKSGFLVYTNVGVSMRPLIREGRDVLTIRKADPEKLGRYDVVLFRRDGVKGRGRYVLHRILKLLPDGRLWIVGDNCTSGETVDAAQVLGVLELLRRGQKTVKLSGFAYKAYVYLWCAPYHLRFFALRAKNAVRYIVGAVKYKLGRLLGKS